MFAVEEQLEIFQEQGRQVTEPLCRRPMRRGQTCSERAHPRSPHGLLRGRPAGISRTISSSAEFAASGACATVITDDSSVATAAAQPCDVVPWRQPTLEPFNQRGHRPVAIAPPPVGTGPDHVHAVDDPPHQTRIGVLLGDIVVYVQSVLILLVQQHISIVNVRIRTWQKL
jgi:hypothetical protein